MEREILCRFIIGTHVFKLAKMTVTRSEQVIYRIYDNRRRAANTIDYGDIAMAFTKFDVLVASSFVKKYNGGAQ